MNDLISRQAVEEAIEFFLVDPGDGCNDIANERNRVLEYASDKIMHIPPAKGWTPVRHGCWMSKEYEYGTNGEWDRWVERIAIEGDYAYCSLCGGGILLDGGGDYVYSAYCPHCGAKMEEVKNE